MSKKGFTFIEIVVILSVLSILILVATPNFLGRSESAALKKDLGLIEIIENICGIYFDENGVYPIGSEVDAETLNNRINEEMIYNKNELIKPDDILGLSIYKIDTDLIKDFLRDTNGIYYIDNLGNIYKELE